MQVSIFDVFFRADRNASRERHNDLRDTLSKIVYIARSVRALCRKIILAKGQTLQCYSCNCHIAPHSLFVHISRALRIARDFRLLSPQINLKLIAFIRFFATQSHKGEIKGSKGVLERLTLLGHSPTLITS